MGAPDGRMAVIEGPLRDCKMPTCPRIAARECVRAAMPVRLSHPDRTPLFECFSFAIQKREVADPLELVVIGNVNRALAARVPKARLRQPRRGTGRRSSR